MYRILLADDEGIMLESLKKIIETEYGNECEIHCAKSGNLREDDDKGRSDTAEEKR